jgi:NADH-quinone oxidoreductase subunit N
VSLFASVAASGFPYADLFISAAPEAILVIGALAVLFVDLSLMRAEPLQARRTVSVLVSGFGCCAALFWMGNMPAESHLATGMLVVDPLTRFVKAALLVLALFTIVISIQPAFTVHVGEYFALVLMATVGMMFLVSSEEILMIFLALELTSLSLYVLAAFNKQDGASAESALKYFLFGGTAAAFTLFGLSLIYGLSGATSLPQIAAALKQTGLTPLLGAALIMVITGFGFKIAVAPFHLWAPDAYQGAPSPSAALIASGSKVASFFILAKVMLLGFAGLEGRGDWRDFAPGWMPLLALISLLSMILGNLGAIAQSNVKRLLAYSAIAHAGYALLGILAGNERGVSSLLYYVVTYGVSVIGAFGVVAVLEAEGSNGNISDFAGLGRRDPLLSACMLIFMLSLAGIPPLAGFFGKFYLFVAALDGGTARLGLLWLVVVAIAMSAVSLYYYLQILKQIFVVPALAETPLQPAQFAMKAAIVLAAVAVVILGCAPDLMLDPLLAAMPGRH